MGIGGYRDFIRKYGKQYGWEIDDKNRLKFTPPYGERHDFDLSLNAQRGDKTAQQLSDALIKVGRQELKNVMRRKIPTENEFEERILAEERERVRKQKARLSKVSKENKSIVLQNIFRASDDSYTRYTPAERFTPERLKQVAKKEAEWTIGALQNDDFYQYLNYMNDKRLYNAIEKVSEMFDLGINFDEVVKENLKTFADKYQAIEQSYLEIREDIKDRIDYVNLTPDELDELMGDSDVAYLLGDISFSQFPNIGL